MGNDLHTHADPDLGAPISAAEWAGISDAERAFLQQGLDAADRGDLIEEAAMARHFDRLLADIATR
jgi:hypothetical protein